MSRKIILFVFLILFLTFILLGSLWASEFKSGKIVSVSKDETIEGDLFVGGGVITIDGVVNGDLFFGGNTININGEVKGDIIGMGGSLTLNGVAGDDVRLWCGSVIINGSIERSLTAFGNDVILTKSGLVKRDVFIGCNEANVEGEIEGKIRTGSKILQLSGIIGKQAKFEARQVIVHPSAKIQGDLKVSAKKIDIMDGAIIEGKVEKLPYEKKRSKWVSWKFYAVKLVFMIGAIIVGILLIKFLPGYTAKVTEQVRHYWKSLGIGFIVLFCFPIASILVAITLIGIPLAVISLIFYLLSLYTGKIFVSLAVGEKILKTKENASLWALILGIVIFTILFSIPYVGWLIRLIIVILGLGALSIGSFQALKRA